MSVVINEHSARSNTVILENHSPVLLPADHVTTRLVYGGLMLHGRLLVVVVDLNQGRLMLDHGLWWCDRDYASPESCVLRLARRGPRWVLVLGW